MRVLLQLQLSAMARSKASFRRFLNTYVNMLTFSTTNSVLAVIKSMYSQRGVDPVRVEAAAAFLLLCFKISMFIPLLMKPSTLDGCVRSLTTAKGSHYLSSKYSHKLNITIHYVARVVLKGGGAIVTRTSRALWKARAVFVPTSIHPSIQRRAAIRDHTQSPF